MEAEDHGRETLPVTLWDWEDLQGPQDLGYKES